jgi:UTP--glucose-1-phosphate uridylyltransferase
MEENDDRGPRLATRQGLVVAAAALAEPGPVGGDGQAGGEDDVGTGDGVLPERGAVEVGGVVPVEVEVGVGHGEEDTYAACLKGRRERCGGGLDGGRLVEGHRVPGRDPMAVEEGEALLRQGVLVGGPVPGGGELPSTGAQPLPFGTLRRVRHGAHRRLALMSAEGLAAAAAAMRERGIAELAIAAFSHYYRQLAEDQTGLIPEDTIAPPVDVPALADVAGEQEPEQLREALSRTVVVKLNGGLGTSMGISGPKTALPVRDGLTFLDIIARQNLALRQRHGVEIPLILMDSFRTQEESLAILARYPELRIEGLPLDFVQSSEPKLRADDLTPVQWPANPSLEWCPPGHGDLYVSLQSTGLLETLRGKGYRYAFLSNADNLGATCDPAIPAWMATEGVPYVAEVCERTRNDRKGGHLAVRRRDGRLILRDSAQVAPGEDTYFQDTRRHAFFHANNLWVDLDMLARELGARDGLLGLPIIVNRKTVDPTDPSSTPVIQVESAMGTAVEVFEGSRALHVPRSRFRPVKTTNELLLVRSDIFRLDEDYLVESTIDHDEPFVDLSSPYKLIDGFDARFPHGVPSMRRAGSLVVTGDLTFGAGVEIIGDVRLGPEREPAIAAGTVLEGSA